MTTVAITMSTVVMVLLRADHKELRRLFREFKGAGEDATVTKGRLVDKMLELLTVHTYIENEVMYPRVRAAVPDIEADILESYEEHHVADVLCSQLAAMSPEAERFDAKTTVLIESVEHHIEEEEEVWFPKAARPWAVRSCRRSARKCSTRARSRRTTRPSPAP